MDRRDIMKTIGGLGIAAPLGIGTATADDHRKDDGNGREDDGNGRAGNGNEGSGRGGGHTPYGGRDTKTSPELGGFDDVLGYLATGKIPEPSSSPMENDPNLIKWFQLELMERTVEEVIADRQACHDHWKSYWGMDLDGADVGTANVVDPVTGERTARNPGEVNEDNVFKTFVWEPPGDTNAVVREFALMLEPKAGYSNYVKSENGVPNNREPENDTTNGDSFTVNKVRDGGYWIFGIEEDDIPLDSLFGKPTFWFDERGDLRDSGGPQKLSLDEIGPDGAVHREIPQQTGFFRGDYNVFRGDDQDPLLIHYESRFPTEFKPHSGIPRAFICELQCVEFETDRNPKGLGRVHGTTYPPGTTEGYLTGDTTVEEAGGMPVATIRNVLTFPPSRNRPNVAPGLPEDAPPSQTEIPGYPSKFE